MHFAQRVARTLATFPLRSALGLIRTPDLPKSAMSVLTSYTMILYIALWFAKNPEQVVPLGSGVEFFMYPMVMTYLYGDRWRLPMLMSVTVIDTVGLVFDPPVLVIRIWFFVVSFVYVLKLKKEVK